MIFFLLNRFSTKYLKKRIGYFSGKSRSRTQYGFPYQLISNQRSYPDEFIFHCDPTKNRTWIPPLEGACPIQLDDRAILL
jgi:hypothetical protein